MNKKITSMLLCLVMIFSMMTVAVPCVCRAGRVHSADRGGGQNDALAPGEHHDLYHHDGSPFPTSDQIQMVLDIPAGLTYVCRLRRSLAPGLEGDSSALTTLPSRGMHDDRADVSSTAPPPPRTTRARRTP